MKKNLSRILALIIAVASIVSIFSVFSFAQDSSVSAVNDDNGASNFVPTRDLLYNRTFDDGWGALNKFDGIIGSHSAKIDYETGDDGNYNYFARYEHGNKAEALDLYFDLKTNGLVLRQGISVISLSIKADDLCDLGTILKVRLYNTKDADSVGLLVIRGYDLYAFSSNTSGSGKHLGSLQDGDWYDVEFVFDWRDSENLNVTAYLNDEAVGVLPIGNGKNGIEKISLGWTAADASKMGMGYCIDNLLIYQSANITGRIEMPENAGYGKFVSSEEEKTVPIYKNDNDARPETILDEALYMKMGVKSALVAGTRTSIDAAPGYDADGNIMIPLDLLLMYLENEGYQKSVHPDNDSYDIVTPDGMTYITVGRDTASVCGELVSLSVKPGRDENGYAMIGLDDVDVLFPGMTALYDDMGLIAVHKDISNGSGEPLFTREDDLDTMLDIMKKFVFEVEAGSKEDDYIKTGETVYNDIEKATDFLHPYLITNQESFDKLYDIYYGEDSIIKGYLEAALAPAIRIYADMAKEEGGNYVGIYADKKPIHQYSDGESPQEVDDPTTEIDETAYLPDTADGYNPNTLKLYEVEYAAEKLVELAFAYQVTGEAKYAELAYDIMMALGEWTHWGPGYMANCANAAASYAIAYDWLYNYIKADETKGAAALEKLAFFLYDKAIYHGTASSKGSFCLFPREYGFGDQYITRTDSYNAICSSGMIMASLAIMNEKITFYRLNNETDELELVDAETQAANAAQAYSDLRYLVGNNLRNLADYGLNQYAPDGSYVESVTYWALGTNALMKTIMSLESATGKDYGFKNVWALESSFYFACYIANGNGEAWKYHEDGAGTLVEAGPLTVDTQMFNYAGKIFGDEKLIAIRDAQVKGGKAVTMFDVLFYPDGEITADTTLELDYYMEGIDAFVSRSGWEADDLFVGIMGGANKYYQVGEVDEGEMFGQIDSGNFIYENLGVKWIVDHGSDSLFAPRYFGSYRFANYRNSGEGHNMLLVTGLPYGQSENGNGVMYETFIHEKGSYAIIDNSESYSTVVDGARRGMLVTNDRNTVVIQDEMTFGKTVGDAVWVINTYEEIIIDETKQTAYLIHTNDDGSELYLRATILTEQDNVEFTAIDGDNLLSATKNEYTVNKDELAGVNRLAIKFNAVLSLSVAVVFEIVDSTISDLEVGYNYTILDEWGGVFEDTEDVKEDYYDSNTVNFRNLIDYAAVIYDDYTHLTIEIDIFYEKMCNAHYILVANDVFNYRGEYDPEGYDPARIDEPWYEDYVTFMDEYAQYRTIVMKTVNEINKLTKVLSGQ